MAAEVNANEEGVGKEDELLKSVEILIVVSDDLSRLQ